MAINRGALLGLDYALPGYEQGGGTGVPQQARPQQPQDLVGDPAEGLQVVDGTTEDYFKKWADLKSFVHDAEQNLGINVQAPDYTRPESVQLNRIYNKALSDLKNQGNMLKVSQQMLNNALNRGDMFSADPRQQGVAQMRPGQDFYSSRLDPIVSEANDVLGQANYGSGYVEAKKFYDEKHKQLTYLSKTQPDKEAYWLRQRDALVKPRKAEKPYDPYRAQQEYDRSLKMQAAGGFAKKITNLVYGVTEGFVPDPSIVNIDTGDPYLVNHDLEGVNYGGKRIKYVRLDPTSKKHVSEFVMSDGSVIELPEDPMSVIKQILAENSGRFGTDAENVEKWAQDSRMMKGSGELDSDKLLRPDKDEFKKQQIQGYQTVKADTKARIDQIDRKLDEIVGGFLGGPNSWGATKDSFILKDGTGVEMVKDGDSYVITNPGDIWPDATKAKQKQWAKMTRENVRKFLIEEGAHVNEMGTLSMELPPKPTGQQRSNQPVEQDSIKAARKDLL